MRTSGCSIRLRLQCLCALWFLAVPVAPVLAGEPHPIELMVSAGYRLGGRLEVENGRLVLGAGQTLGGNLGYRMSPDALVELTYIQQNTDSEFQPVATDNSVPVTDLTVRSFYVGGVYEHGLGRTHPFAGIGVGITRLDPALDTADSETHFSFNLNGGLRADLSDRIGLKFLVRGLLSTPPDDGSTILCTAPETCYIQSGNSLISQFDLSVGLVLRP